MKETTRMFLSFETKNEYLHSVNVWKYTISNINTQLRSIKTEISKSSRESQICDSSIYKMESLTILKGFQSLQLTLSQTAHKMYEIRKKMRKMAGKQMAKRLSKESKVLVSV